MSDQPDTGDVDRWDLHCSRCGDEYPLKRDHSLCESCEKEIQLSKLMDGIRCERCDGGGWVYGTICDVQRAMNGRDIRCPECHGIGRVAWRPDPEDVHPDLRAEVMARVE
jgi:DNA-directed RNA polymerase subunit RPC12/RpoP